FLVCVSLGFVSAGPNVTLYSLEGYTGATITIDAFSHNLDILGFDDVTVGLCGQGAWMLYEDHDYRYLPTSWTQSWIAPNYECIELPSTHHKQMSSLRYVGTGDMYEETITLYVQHWFGGGEDLFLRDEDDLGPFSNFATSMAITGGSPWTVYRNAFWGGTAICLEPTQQPNSDVFFGAWDQTQIGMMDNTISSIRKGCYSDIRLQY
ncbi:unnamed protein product, partial [Meganyctiphanes norvegica]